MKAVKPVQRLGSAPRPTDERPFAEKTALVLCGGGGKGAMEVGFYRALVELGVQIDLIVGTSIGALNGAFIAAGGTPAELERIWHSVRPSELFCFNWEVLWKFKRADSLYSNAGIRAFLERRSARAAVREAENSAIRDRHATADGRDRVLRSRRPH